MSVEELIRLDVLLPAQGLVKSRRRAKELIEAGQVYLLGAPLTKPARLLPPDAPVEIRGEMLPYVGRGGLKLEHALEAFSLSVEGLTCADIGASTGGFTDCMLKRGAARVYAVDVGTDQLDASLRNDARVTVLEQTDARSLRIPGEIPAHVDFLTADVSFISLTLLLPAFRGLLASEGSAVLLVKPQFEAGRAELGKGGIVRSPSAHRQALSRVCAAGRQAGLSVRALLPSPIRGGDGAGNREYLALAGAVSVGGEEELIRHAVAAAFRNDTGEGTQE